mgnify:CR=1 FL=1
MLLFFLAKNDSINIMKKDIHPTYYAKAEIKCACGNTIHTGSTKEKMEVEICSACHPFYTGKEKIIDTAGRVEKFKSRQARAKKVVVKKPRIKKEEVKKDK